MIFIVLGIILVTVLSFYFRQTYSRFSNYGVKHFKTVPFFGNLTNIILGTSTVAEELTTIYYDFRDERFVGRYEFTKPTIIVKDLDLLKKITTKDFEHFIDHRQFVDEENDALFTRNLFSLRGEEWKEMRATLSPAFTGSKIKQMLPFMEEVGNQMILVLKKQIKESKSGVLEVNIKDLTSRYTNDVIFSCAFGLQVDSHSERENLYYKVGKMATTFSFRQAILFSLGAALPWLVKILNLRFFSNTTKEFFTNIVLNTMKDRESRKIMRPDMIQILMDLKKGKLKHDENNGADIEGDTGFATVEESAVGNKKVNREWSDVDLIAQAVVFFLAGYETISTTTSFILHELALNPEVQERLAKEIREHDAKNGGKVDFNSIQNLTYMDMVISESLRMWPPIMQLDRVCVKDYNIGKPNPKAPKDYIMIFIVLGIILVTVLAFYFRQTYSRFSNYGVKHFKPVPFLGNMTNVILRKSNMGEELTPLYKEYRDERFVGRYEFTKPTIVIKDLDLLKKITIKDFEHFLDHRQFLNEKKEPLFTRNLFSLRGEEWKEMRTTLSPAFTSSKLKQMVPFIEEVGEHMILALKQQIKESKSGVIEVDIRDLTSRYTNDVIFSCAFGLKVDSYKERDNQFYKVGKITTSFSFRQGLLFSLGAVFPWLTKTFFDIQFFSKTTNDFFTNIVLNTMKERDSNKVMRPDMIQILMDLKKGQLKYDEKNGADIEQDTGFATVEELPVGKNKVDRVWSDVDLIAQAVVFFLAGYETISTATSLTLHELALNPEAQERLAQEIKEHDAKNGGKVNYNSIQNLTYLDMVISESLRMWPPLLQLDRVCVKDYNIGKPNPKAPKEYIVRKGEYINIPVWSIHRDPEFYPNPDKFDPERFSSENKHKINPVTYMPFGIGPRNCIGSRFALCECKILLYQILLHAEVSPSEKTCIPSKLAPDSFTTKLQGGHWLNIKARY